MQQLHVEFRRTNNDSGTGIKRQISVHVELNEDNSGFCLILWSLYFESGTIMKMF